MRFRMWDLQDELDRLHEQMDNPNLWPLSAQDFLQSDTGSPLRPVGEARHTNARPVADALLVATGRASAPTPSKE